MKQLGLIGGTSWHSTIEYYRIINQSVNDHFGDNTNPPLVLINVNQSKVHQYQRSGQWENIAEMMTVAGRQAVAAGAEAVMFCANTPHRVFDEVTRELTVPMLHIADATAQAIKKQGLASVGFIGTKYSMDQDFVTGRIASREIEVHVPETAEEREELHRIIQQELTYGRIIESSRQFVEASIAKMAQRGAKGMVLGCTEFPLMFANDRLEMPSFNTTEIHAKAAAEFVLSGDCE